MLRTDNRSIAFSDCTINDLPKEMHRHISIYIRHYGVVDFGQQPIRSQCKIKEKRLSEVPVDDSVAHGYACRPQRLSYLRLQLNISHINVIPEFHASRTGSAP